MNRRLFIFSITSLMAGLGIRATSAAQTESHQITEIILEHINPWIDTIYKVVFRRKGVSTYYNMLADFNSQYGHTEGIRQFDRLEELMLSRGFFELNDIYSKEENGHDTIITSAVRDGKIKSVANYADVGPAKLREIEKAITDAAAQAKWEVDRKLNE